MIIPSIDLMGGNAVQLVGGERHEVDAGDPRPLARKFGLVGDVAVIDLDAALGRGDNRATIEDLLAIAPCRVGGGIRDADSARRWLDAGARQVILGTAATPEVLGELPRERVIAALDARDGEVVVEGWTKGTGRGVLERIEELRAYVGGFLVTFVEVEGSMKGLPIDRIREIVQAAGDAKVTVAGGVRGATEIAQADALGADCQVGMALYKGEIDLADSLAACLTSDRPDGLWPTIVCDERNEALGLAYSNLRSLRDAIENQRGTYWSRSRDSLWVKGASSGAEQELLGVSVDCDRDALRFTVRQAGAGFCHTGSRSCFGQASGLGQLSRRLTSTLADAPEGSYTKRLASDPDLLRAKLVEEANELCDAASPADVAWETADVLYFALVAMTRSGVTLEEVERQLDLRAMKVSRRKGDAKPQFAKAAEEIER